MLRSPLTLCSRQVIGAPRPPLPPPPGASPATRPVPARVPDPRVPDRSRAHAAPWIDRVGTATCPGNAARRGGRGQSLSRSLRQPWIVTGARVTCARRHAGAAGAGGQVSAVRCAPVARAIPSAPDADQRRGRRGVVAGRVVATPGSRAWRGPRCGQRGAGLPPPHGAVTRAARAPLPRWRRVSAVLVDMRRIPGPHAVLSCRIPRDPAWRDGASNQPGFGGVVAGSGDGRRLWCIVRAAPIRG